MKQNTVKNHLRIQSLYERLDKVSELLEVTFDPYNTYNPLSDEEYL